MAEARRPREPVDDRLRRRGITRREAEVLRLVVAPFGNAEIAAALGVSKRTVESHVSALLRKLDVPDRTALLRVAARLTAAPGHAGAGSVHGRALAAEAEVRRRNAIALHETAAARLHGIAAGWSARAHLADDEAERAACLARALTVSRRAQAALARADAARERARPAQGPATAR
jgi:DNA-binding CsgD family transcriptional regulator